MPTQTIEAAKNEAAHTEEFIDWLRGHGLTPENTFRVDLDTEAGTMIVHQYALNAEGKKFAVRTDEDAELAHNPVVGQPALREPFTVEIVDPVPEAVLDGPCV